MERITISLDTELAAAFDAMSERRGYANRSEAVRDVLREAIERDRLERSDAPWCVATVSYLYNHHERSLADRVVELQHAHHDLTVASMHAHLDHEHCVETLLLRGPTVEVRACAQRLIAERGVHHGHVHLVPVERDVDRHAHGAGHHTHPEHQHLRPAT